MERANREIEGMLQGVRGNLVSGYFAEHLLPVLFRGRLGEDSREGGRTRLAKLCGAATRSLGPASSLRAIYDVAAATLLDALAFRPASVAPLAGRDRVAALGLALEPDGSPTQGTFARPGPVAMLVVPWGEHLDSAWRDGVRLAGELGTRWCLLFNALALRLIDAYRAYSRDNVEFDLAEVCEDERSFAVLWSMLRAQAFTPMSSATGRVGGRRPRDRGARAGQTSAATRSESPSCLLEEILERSALHGTGVCRSLREGVLRGLGVLMQGFADAGSIRVRGAGPAALDLQALFEQSLTIVYRVLFLLFAEARHMLPTWHAVYRDAYSIEALRASAERTGSQAATGTWETLQAIWRLAHRGCRAGSLVVTPFNGRLFSPARTPLADSGRLDDNVAREAIVALSTVRQARGTGRVRIAYRDLGVEQLGAVYESVLDYEPRVEEDTRAKAGARPASRTGKRAPCRTHLEIRLQPGSGRRKASGTFYTPRSLTGYLVRRTLYPLVAHATSEDILRLRVVDPAMGSGAFLVVACQYLAAAYERALLAEGRCHASDIDERDRASFRRTIAQRSLFGVDLNPMAVQLARLSLWLATLAGDRPLTFLDHHLATGDSLAGASVFDVFRHPASRRAAAARDTHPGLFDTAQLRADLEHVLPERLRLASEPSDTLAAVQEKERCVQRLACGDSPTARWKSVADLWCACWFWKQGQPPGRGAYQELVDIVLARDTSLPRRAADELLERARRICASHRFLHWHLEFPEVFFDPDGRPLENPGFDAVVGNPPWDMLRADATSDGDSKAYDRALTAFAHRSGIYCAQSDGHPNRFQLFVERAFQIARRGGRVGLVVPWGLLADSGCRSLRRLLFERADTDTIVGFDNASRVFPIHRSLRFALFTSTTGRTTKQTSCRFGERHASTLDSLPDSLDLDDSTHYPVRLAPSLLGRLSGEDLSVPHLRSQADLDIVDHVSALIPWLSAREGWRARFGRELNATDDRPHFLAASGQSPGSGDARRLLPVVEGKHLEPYRARVEEARYVIDEEAASRILGGTRPFSRWRLAYRDVASATNRVTLIAAVLPPDCVTTHTVFCLKNTLPEPELRYLCAVMNSYVANYLVRLRVTTHLSAGVLERLPVPTIPMGSETARRVIEMCRRLAAGGGAGRDETLQALVARLYSLNLAQYAHILDTFPLIDQAQRNRAFEQFRRLEEPAPRLDGSA
jgi:hypothetical protein